MTVCLILKRTLYIKKKEEEIVPEWSKHPSMWTFRGHHEGFQAAEGKNPINLCSCTSE